jgi:hypothetical protein
MRRVSQTSDFGCKPADSAILFGDRLACGAESAFAIGQPDFGGLAALLRLAYCAAHFVDLCAGCEWHHDLITSLLCRAASLGCAYRQGQLPGACRYMTYPAANNAAPNHGRGSQHDREELRHNRIHPAVASSHASSSAMACRSLPRSLKRVGPMLPIGMARCALISAYEGVGSAKSIPIS